MNTSELRKVREWADQKLATGEEPPWAWYQYMKLRETLDAILAGETATTPPTESLPESAERPGSGPRLVVSNGQRDTARSRSEAQPVQLPM